jgi:hypothetical protein
MKRRFQSTEENRLFVLQKCKPSPFLYQLLSAPLREASRREPVCIPCVNWKRRVETGGLKRTKTPMLQLDQLLCFLMQPGTYMEPDQRCMERLIRGARQTDNPFRGIFPISASVILDTTKENTYHDCVRAWWEYNGRTEFFASGQEARRVRCVVKSLMENSEEL